MFALILALSASCPPALTSFDPLVSPETSEVRSSGPTTDDPKEEYKKRREAAGDDIDKLWDLWEWCDAYGLGKEGRSCLRRIVKLDPEHKSAREALGHIYYDGKWFTTQKKLDKYKKEEEERKAKEEGLVRYKGEWVKQDDLPYIKRGMMRDENGDWVDAETYKRTKEGWVRQDLVWVSPDEKGQIEKGLWKCDDKWLSLEKADEFHSKIGKWWIIPSDYFIVYSTCSRETVMKSIDEMDRAIRDLARIYGGAPSEPVPVVVLRSQDQYSEFAAGKEGIRNPTESHGLSSIHYSYFADAFFVEKNGEPEWVRAGVCYWDTSAEHGDTWGKHAARHAAGQSFAEFMDPSTKVIDTVESAGPQGLDFDDFYSEKKIPSWFRAGAVTYAERYFVDNLVASGGNAYWAREWSIQNILNKGGLRSVDDIVSGELSADNPDDSAKLLNESGLLMAFILDGKCAPVKEAHGAVKAALKKGGDAKKEFKALVKAIEKHDSELRQFAGI